MPLTREQRDAANWQAVLANARDAIISIDARGRVTLFNPMAERIFGYALDEVLGRNVKMLMPLPYRDEHDQYIKRYRETRVAKAIGKIRYVEARRKSGEIFPIELSVSESQLDNGVLYTAIIRDVSEKVALEEALRRERDLARQVVDTAQVIILILDPQGKIVRYNAYMEEVSGYPLEAVAGKDWFATFLPEEEQSRIRTVFDNVIRGTPVQGNVNSLLTRDGRVLQIEWRARLLRDAAGDLIGVLCSGQDITEHLRARAEIEARVRQQAAVALLGLDALSGTEAAVLMGEAIDTVAEMLKVEYVKIMQLLPGSSDVRVAAGRGWRPGVVGETVLPLTIDSHLSYALRSANPIVIEDLNRETRFTPSPILREHNVVSGVGAIIGGPREPYGILGAYTAQRRSFSADDANFLQTVANVLAECVARERTELALRESQRAAQQRERLADIGAITAKVVHDLGNPLAALSMQTQLIVRRAKRGDITPADPILQPAEQILSTLARLEALVREFTDFARDQRLAVVDLDTVNLLREVAALWRPLGAAQGVDLIVEQPAVPIEIRADEEKLRRVLDNLVKNAIDAIQRGPAKVILRAAALPSGKVQIVVADEGSGIPEDLDVFRLFETTKPEGTGIGLAIAKQLVEAHGGTITHRPNSPHGTVFEIQLPHAPSAAATLDGPPLG